MTAIATRRVAGAATLVVLVYLVQVALFAPGARANHIPATGPVPGNCVEIQLNDVSGKTPSSFPAVTVTVTEWHEDNKGFDFTIAGLAEGYHVDISVMSGQDIEEPGGFGNGSHSWDHDGDHDISHIRVCVFEDLSEETTTTGGEETTTTEGSTTTTEGSTTTTGALTSTSALGQTTTTEVGPSTTAVGQTTTTEVGPSTTAVEQTTTSEDEDEPAATGSTTPPEATSDTLPFTGADPGAMIQLGLVALLTGAAALWLVGGRQEEEISVERPSWS